MMKMHPDDLQNFPILMMNFVPADDLIVPVKFFKVKDVKDFNYYAKV